MADGSNAFDENLTQFHLSLTALDITRLVFVGGGDCLIIKFANLNKFSKKFVLGFSSLFPRFYSKFLI